MQQKKHNQALCSNLQSRESSSRGKSKKSQLNGYKFSWPLLFLGVFLIVLFLGFSPLRILIDNIKANYAKTQKIRFYPTVVDQDKQPESYENGWWNIENTLNSPQISPEGSFTDFNDLNSGFYTGGNYSLSYYNFDFLDEELGILKQEESDNANPSDILSEGEVITENEQPKESEIILDIYQDTNDSEVIMMNEEEAVIEETIRELENQVESILGNVETDIKENEAGQNQDVINMPEPNTEDVVPESTNEEVGDIQDGKINEVNQDTVTNAEVSISNWIDLLSINKASAGVMETTKLKSLSDLGRFKSAVLNLSIGINENGFVPKTNETTFVGEEQAEAMGEGQEPNIELETPSDNAPEGGTKEAIENSSPENTFSNNPEEENYKNELSPETSDRSIVPVENDLTIEESVEIQEIDSDSGDFQILIEEESAVHNDNNTGEQTLSEDIVSYLFGAKDVNAQMTGVAETKMIIWYAVSASSSADELVWHELDTIDSRHMSNLGNGNYLNINLPFLNDWEDIEALHIKVEAVDSENSFVAYIDSLWLDVDYEPSELVYEINKRKDWEKALELVSSNIDFKMDEQGKLKFRYQKNRQALLNQVGEFFGFVSFWEDVDIEVSLVDVAGQVVDLPLSMIFEEDGEFEIQLPYLPRGFRPGKYSIVFSITDNSGASSEKIDIRQDFSWGVLALNTNKSIYQDSDDSTYIQLAVLDDFGRTLCDADLALSIVSPSGVVSDLTTGNGKIVRNPECGPDNVIDMPDYYAFYMIDELGDYQVTLSATTTNGVYQIQDSFTKTDYVSFDVERFGPTRIYPVANYDMSLLITANEDFSGSIHDYVPNTFSIATQTLMIKTTNSGDFEDYNSYKSSTSSRAYYEEADLGYELELTWGNIEISKGEQLLIAYEFDAPNISPEFFLVGALEMADFREARQWQIASDAIVTATSTNGVHVGWTTPTQAWDAENNNLYASRAIPKKTGGGEPANYIQSNTNTILDLGGDINSVEVGIEGYVANTAVTAYIVPYFGGSTAGSIYSITGATLGIGSDDQTTDYVNITNSTNAPSTWTWADIQNLDIRIYGGNTSNSTNYNMYVDQIRIRVDYTGNTAPNSKFISAFQRVDTSGVVDITVEVYDTDNDDSSARLDYVSGMSCDFSSPLDPTLDETDANATSSPGDAKIDNSEIYQIGNLSGWITMSGGTSTVYFDWLSASNTNNMEGDFCLQLTANDGENIDLTPATTTLVIDNKTPSLPGTFTGASSTKSSVKLWYGSVSSDLHFNEYRIYYATTPDINTSDNLHASTTDVNLNDINFNGEASTTITGLLEDTTYYFAMYAYDDYGHFSSSTVFSYKTNSAPTSAFTVASPATQRTNGSGIVDISIDVDDLDNNDSIVRIDYVQGADCNFASPPAPTLDETPANISSSYGLVKIENDNTYQIGNSAGYILTPATNTIAFDWDTSLDIADANDTYCLQITANDLIDDENEGATTTLTLDTLAPTAPGNLTLDAKSTSTIKLNFGTDSVETNFAYYKIHYKQGVSGVTTGNTEHVDADLSAQDYNSSGSTTIFNLTPNTDYVFNIWAYDLFGNVSSAVEVTIKTDSTVQNNSLTFLNPAVSNWAIADGASVYTFEALVSEGNGWNVLDDVVLSLANNTDDASPYSDLEFTWNQTLDTFGETGADINSTASLDPTSNASCGGETCTLQFNLVFNNNFTSSSVNYSANLYSTNDSAIYDEDEYADFYQVKVIRVEQVHYRWRNDDGGE